MYEFVWTEMVLVNVWMAMGVGGCVGELLGDGVLGDGVGAWFDGGRVAVGGCVGEPLVLAVFIRESIRIARVAGGMAVLDGDGKPREWRRFSGCRWLWVTKSFIVGRSSARVPTRRNDTERVCSISCIVGSALPLSFWSSISDGSPPQAKWFLTH